MIQDITTILKSLVSRLLDVTGGGLSGSGRFESPWYLLLLIPLVLLTLWALRRKPPTVMVPWLKPFVAADPPRRLRIFSLPLWLAAAGIALMVVALARPQKGIEELTQRAEGIDIILCLDLSGSMKSIDVPPGIGRNEMSRGAAAGKFRPVFKR